MDSYLHPETGQYLPMPNIPITYNTDKQQQIKFNNPINNTNQPSNVPFIFRGSVEVPKPITNTDFNNTISNQKKETEKKETEKKENEKNTTIDNMFTELSHMRSQIQNLSVAIDNMFTILSKLK
jgi:hypothetical protein